MNTQEEKSNAKGCDNTKNKRNTVPQEEAVSISKPEILRGFLSPFSTIELFLGSKERLSKTVSQQKNLSLLALLLLFDSLLFPLLYGAIGPVDGAWKICILYTGPLAICFPSLIVFSNYLGFKRSLMQNLVMALLISCTAAMFTFGFAPIIWFIEYTTLASSQTPASISVFFLFLSLMLGILHNGRCFFFKGVENGRTSEFYQTIWVFWQALLVYIHYRMAELLGLLK
ncbi:MAG: hypothetical protein GY757_43855 [bacterium]|nr:hypothetical protein [bacterium]